MRTSIYSTAVGALIDFCGAVICVCVAMGLVLLLVAGLAYALSGGKPAERLTIEGCLQKGGDVQLDRWGELQGCIIRAK